MGSDFVAHAQPIDPVTYALETAGLTEPLLGGPRRPAGDNRPDALHHRLQDILPEIQAVAQRVGGFKYLAAIAELLAGMG